MARARFARGARRSGARPNRAWSMTAESAYTTIPAASKVLLVSFIPNPVADQTILRLVGGLSVASDQASTTENLIGAVGCILVTDIAAAAGISSIPSPFTQGNDDGWFFHQVFSSKGVVSLTGPSSIWYPIDSRAKRIMDGEGITLAVVGENAHASEGCEVLLQFRVLTQLRGTG